VLIPQQQRDTAIAALARLDPLDVLAAIGALQLLPENANAIFRLKTAAGVASTAAPIEDGSGIVDEAAIAWVNRPVFGAVADPFNNVFTDEFLLPLRVLRRLSRPARGGVLHRPDDRARRCSTPGVIFRMSSSSRRSASLQRR
jgi:hypothetical protein